MISAQLSRTETSQKTEKLTKKKLKKRDALSALLKMQVITSRRFFVRSQRIFPFFSLRNPAAQNARNSMSSCYRDEVNQLAREKTEKLNCQKCGALKHSLGHVYGDADLWPTKSGSHFGMSRMNDLAETFGEISQWYHCPNWPYLRVERTLTLSGTIWSYKWNYKCAKQDWCDRKSYHIPLTNVIPQQNFWQPKGKTKEKHWNWNITNQSL